MRKIRYLRDPPSALAPIGFVVLIVFLSPLTTQHELDVVGVYVADTPQRASPCCRQRLGSSLCRPRQAGNWAISCQAQSKP